MRRRTYKKNRREENVQTIWTESVVSHGFLCICSGVWLVRQLLALLLLIFKNTIRQWQCIFTLVGQMIPVNGLMALAHTNNISYDINRCAPFIGVTVETECALWLWLWCIWSHLYTYMAFNELYRISALLQLLLLLHACTEYTHILCAMYNFYSYCCAQLNSTKENKTKQYFKVYDYEKELKWNNKAKKKSMLFSFHSSIRLAIRYFA